MAWRRGVEMHIQRHSHNKYSLSANFLPEVRLTNAVVPLPRVESYTGLGDCACISRNQGSRAKRYRLEFTDRVLERNWLLHPAGSNQVVIDAPKGYGKTTLLERVIEDCQQTGWITVFIDISAYQSNINMLQAMMEQISSNQQVCTEEFLCIQHILTVLAGQNTILCFDCCESDTRKIEWLREQVVPTIRRGLRGVQLRTVFSGTNFCKRSDLDWAGYTFYNLSPFKWFDIHDILQRASANDEYARRLNKKDYIELALAIHRLSGGHPTVVEFLVQKVTESRWTITFSEEQCEYFFKAYVQDILAELLEKYALTEHELEILKVLSIFRGVNLKTILSVMEAGKIPSSEPLDVLSRFKRIGIFREKKSNEFFYRDLIVRELILAKTRTVERGLFLDLTRMAREMYHKWFSDIARMSPYGLPVSKEDFLQLITVESFYHTLHLKNFDLLREEFYHLVQYSSETLVCHWLTEDDDVCIYAEEFFQKPLSELLEQLNLSSQPSYQKQKGDITMKTQELIILQAKAEQLGLRLKELDTEHEKGMLPDDKWLRMKSTVGTERRVILSQIKDELTGIGVEDLNPIIDQVTNEVPEKQVKENLQEVAQNKGWGQSVLDKITEYRGEIVGLIVSVAIEISKQLLLK